MIIPLPTKKYSDRVAIAGCTDIGSASASFKKLVTLHRSTSADILVERQLWPPLDMVTFDWSKNSTN